MDFVSLTQLKRSTSYTYKSDGSEIEGTFRILAHGVNPIVLFNVVRSSEEDGYVPLGVHTIVLIGWALDTDDFIMSICLQPFSEINRFDCGQSNLLGLILSGPTLSPRPVLLGADPEIEASPQVEQLAEE